ncbi:hypothetical protein HGRIS_011239 [Hohenbuehelia grisea]|uniref:non-specific serine/threonine protein kinase n=1 Tax=Hohenbuehelia grisea TaxID=104357 RepID=A0ABR3JVE2_9AGAR
MLRLIRSISTSIRATSTLRTHPTTGFKLIDPSVKVEEEGLEWYSPTRFYPVSLGQVLNSKYQVLVKLGFGSCSTAWLCRDLDARKYVAVKVCIADYPSVARESAVYAHMRSVLDQNEQLPATVRASVDEFDIAAEHAQHRCFVFEPLGVDLPLVKQILGSSFDETVFKRIAIHVLRSLDFLHSKAKVVHTDIRAENIHLAPVGDTCFRLTEQVELEAMPSDRKIDGSRVIYASSSIMFPTGDVRSLLGLPVLIDYGEARFGQDNYMDRIQPYMYQAPEVISDIPWSYPADIWNVGVMLWDFFEGKRLLSAANEHGDPSLYHLLAEMIALMGSPPESFLDALDKGVRESVFGPNGNWTSPKGVSVPPLALETAETALKAAGKDNTAFLNFMKRILVWDPTHRPTAAQLLEDPWLEGVALPENGIIEPN